MCEQAIDVDHDRMTLLRILEPGSEPRLRVLALCKASKQSAAVRKPTAAIATVSGDIKIGPHAKAQRRGEMKQENAFLCVSASLRED